MRVLFKRGDDLLSAQSMGGQASSGLLHGISGQVGRVGSESPAADPSGGPGADRNGDGGCRPLTLVYDGRVLRLRTQGSLGDVWETGWPET